MTTTLVETNNREEALRVKLSLRECLFGDKAFYGKVATVVIPMIIQNTLSNIVGLLDNVMVGRVGQLPMSAVAIVNQILFIFYLYGIKEQFHMVCCSFFEIIQEFFIIFRIVYYEMLVQ